MRLRSRRLELVVLKCSCDASKNKTRKRNTIHVLIAMMIVSCSSSTIRSFLLFCFRINFYDVQCAIAHTVFLLIHSSSARVWSSCTRLADKQRERGRDREREGDGATCDDVWESRMLELFMWYGADAAMMWCSPYLLRNGFCCCYLGCCSMYVVVMIVIIHCLAFGDELRSEKYVKNMVNQNWIAFLVRLWSSIALSNGENLSIKVNLVAVDCFRAAKNRTRKL